MIFIPCVACMNTHHWSVRIIRLLLFEEFLQRLILLSVSVRINFAHIPFVPFLIELTSNLLLPTVASAKKVDDGKDCYNFEAKSFLHEEKGN